MGAPESEVPLSPAASHYSYEHEGDRQFATTLARGLEVLRCFTPMEPMLGWSLTRQNSKQLIPLPPEPFTRPILRKPLTTRAAKS